MTTNETNETKPRTAKQMLRLLAKLRAAGAREYSSHEAVRRHYRDGFTDGWASHEEATTGEVMLEH